MKRQQFAHVLAAALICFSLGVSSASVLAAAEAPDEAWRHRYGRSNASEIPRALALSPDNTVHVAGIILKNNSSDLFIIKLKENGRAQFRRKFSVGAGSSERVDSLAVDSQGYAYVGGSTFVGPGDERAVILKYAPGGRRVWAKVLTGTDLGGTSYARFAKVTVDALDNLYVALEVRSFDSELVVVKFDPLGNELWRQVAPEGRRPTDVAIEPGGNLVIAGEGRAPQGDADWIAVKYSPEGQLLWSRRLRGQNGKSDRPADLAVGDDGGIHIAGYRSRRVSRPESATDFAVARYTDLGTLDWKRIHRGPAKQSSASSVDVDSEGNVFVGGSTAAGLPDSQTTGPDLLTAKYSADGRTQWKRTWTGLPIYAIDRVTAIRATGDGGVVVGAQAYPPNQYNIDYMFLRYSATGELLWVQKSMISNNNDFLEFMEIGDDGAIYGAGYAWTGTQHDLHVVKLAAP